MSIKLFGVVLIAFLLLAIRIVTSQALVATPGAGQGRGGGGAAQGPRGGGAQTDPNAVTAGEFLIDPPTLINLGFEWFIQGDENRNAAVAVSYRKEGRN